MKSAANLLIMLALLGLAVPGAAEKHSMSGLVLTVSPSHRSMTVSCQSVPGYMDAMAMPFDVRDPKVLEGVKPGATIDFTLVEDGNSSYAESIRVRQDRN
ncbi:MAG: copper-binding protein, partial [Terriglobales bacterium]